jgi:hypothetical protein
LKFSAIYGVDFSGAKQAGRNTWVAEIRRGSGRGAGGPLFELVGLARLEKLCGASERAAALAHLVEMIAGSEGALWALDFPFGLPVEVMGANARWGAQFDLLHEWRADDYGLGLECIRRSEKLVGRKHIRRLTDIEEKAPFDPYHYRIIYQTFYGMSDVLRPLRRRRQTAILPFHYRRLPSARRVIVEACPASTLKRLNLPHQNYKQPEGGPLAPRRRRTRRAILDGLGAYVRIKDTDRRRLMRDGGADALDSVIAAIGAARSWRASDHRSIARHHRYPHEGRLYV